MFEKLAKLDLQMKILNPPKMAGLGCCSLCVYLLTMCVFIHCVCICFQQSVLAALYSSEGSVMEVRFSTFPFFGFTLPFRFFGVEHWWLVH